MERFNVALLKPEMDDRSPLRSADGGAAGMDCWRANFADDEDGDSAGGVGTGGGCGAAAAGTVP